MRFTKKADEFEELKTDTLEKLANYVSAIQNASYGDLQDITKRLPLVTSYSELVQSNAAFRTFLFKDKIQDILKDELE